jgi:hypothetical protein
VCSSVSSPFLRSFAGGKYNDEHTLASSLSRVFKQLLSLSERSIPHVCLKCIEISVQELKSAINELESLVPLHAQKAEEMLEAFGGALYPVDLLALAVLNRSIDLLQGFCLLIKADNYLAAAPLVRMQLDNLLRFSAVWLVSDSHEFAMSIMRGTPVRDLKDKDERKMHDSALVSELEKKSPWVKRVYRETSGFVHLSEKHIFSLLDKPSHERQRFELSIGRSGEKVPAEFKIEAVVAFAKITNEVFHLVDGWVFTKSNPAFVAELKESRYDSKA